MTNNAGLGANAACSAVCNLANELLPVVKEAESTGSGRPTTAELTAAFDRYEAKQRPIGKSCISMSRRVTAMATSESWLWSAVNRYVMPCIPARLKVLPIVTLEEKLPRLNDCPKLAGGARLGYAPGVFDVGLMSVCRGQVEPRVPLVLRNA